MPENYAEPMLPEDPLMAAPLDPAAAGTDPMAGMDSGADPESMAMAAFEVAMEHLPMMPDALVDQALSAFSAEAERRAEMQTPEEPMPGVTGAAVPAHQPGMLAGGIGGLGGV